MTAPARFRQSDVTRAIRSAKDAGVRLSKILILPNGGIEMTFGGDAKPKGKSSWDGLLDDL